MNRHLVCDFDEDNDSSDNLTEELFDYGLINDVSPLQGRNQAEMIASIIFFPCLLENGLIFFS
jgi:hypothetical protein